jgi:predicted GH43/DUF377 family glycosyl hydrolase
VKGEKKMRRISAIILAFLIGTGFALCFRTILCSSDGVTWIKYTGNPLDPGLDEVVEPWVIYDGQMFKMWYTGITGPDRVHRIYYATSPDGFNWTPYGMVLDKGGAGSWEELSVRGPVVLFDGTNYEMWYLGYSHNPFPAHRIGFANSTDGVVWQKYEQNPILIPGQNNGWDDGSLGEFTVFFNGTTYIMWYNGQAYMHSTLKIGVATSLDGISWTKYSNNPVLVPGPSEWDGYHIYTGPVSRNGSSYQMWYSGQQFPSAVRVGLATSPDGFSWSKHGENPVLDIGPPGTWDSSYVFATSIVEKDDKLLMWYWGGSDPAGGTERIGLATSYLPYMPVEVDFNPNSLSLRSMGEWITGYIELPEGYDVADINVSSLMLNDTVLVDPDAPTLIGDYDEDGVPDLMVKFDRSEVAAYILANVNVTKIYEERFMTITLTVTGYLNDDTMFQGSNTIKVIFIHRWLMAKILRYEMYMQRFWR